jgi:predicted nuclease with TOPRIM domain
LKQSQTQLHRTVNQDRQTLQRATAERTGVEEALDRHESKENTIAQRLEELKTNIANATSSLELCNRKHSTLVTQLGAVETKLRQTV